MQYTVTLCIEIKARSRAKAEQLVTALAAEQFGALDCTILGIDPHLSNEEIEEARAWAHERMGLNVTEGASDEDRLDS